MMDSWPDLSRYARAIAVPGVATSLFFYDSGSVPPPREGTGSREAAGPRDESGPLPVILVHGLGD